MLDFAFYYIRQLGKLLKSFYENVTVKKRFFRRRLKKGQSYWQRFEVNLKKRKKVKIKDVVGVRGNDTIKRKKNQKIQNRKTDRKKQNTKTVIKGTKNRIRNKSKKEKTKNKKSKEKTKAEKKKESKKKLLTEERVTAL